MSLIATDTPYFSNLVKAELMPEVSFCRGVVVVNDTAPGKDDDDIENWISTITQPGNKFLEQQIGVPDGYNDIEQFKKDLGKNVNSWTGTPKFRLESVGRGKYLINLS